MVEAKSFDITKREVWEAYKRVRANRGAAGVDGVTLAEFDQNLTKNLYRIWNRMASGSYFPPAVKRVDIPKSDGKTRPLGIPTVADRIAQMVVQNRLEPILEPVFHEDSYGYRPGRSAHDALRTARRRCWRYDWVLDLDIKGFFDNIDHDLMMRAVKKHTDCHWVILYIERWLKADVLMPDGTLESRNRGTPQGESSVRCWRICSCITRSINGWHETILRYPSSAMLTMKSATVAAWQRCSPYRPSFRKGWLYVSCKCTRTKPALFTAPMRIGEALIASGNSTSWDIPSSPGKR